MQQRQFTEAFIITLESCDLQPIGGFCHFKPQYVTDQVKQSNAYVWIFNENNP